MRDGVPVCLECGGSGFVDVQDLEPDELTRQALAQEDERDNAREREDWAADRLRGVEPDD